MKRWHIPGFSLIALLIVALGFPSAALSQGRRAFAPALMPRINALRRASANL
jgi:hypothetical protein